MTETFLHCDCAVARYVGVDARSGHDPTCRVNPAGPRERNGGKRALYQVAARPELLGEDRSVGCHRHANEHDGGEPIWRATRSETRNERTFR